MVGKPTIYKINLIFINHIIIINYEIKIYKIMKKIIFIIFTFTLLACSQPITKLSVVSTKNVDLESIDPAQLGQGVKVTGKDKKLFAFIFPTGITRLGRAVDDALKKGNGDLMLDATFYYRYWWFLVGLYGYEVEGTVVNTKEVK